MVQGRLKSGRFRKIKVKTPGGTLKIRYEKKLPGVAQCGKCGAKLHGIPRLTTVMARKMPKTKKRPERPYGGSLCTRCTRMTLKEKIIG